MFATLRWTMGRFVPFATDGAMVHSPRVDFPLMMHSPRAKPARAAEGLAPDSASHPVEGVA